jgi:glucuronate isomerase
LKNFIDDDFLLSTACARRLYHEAAANEPIFDYHCHLDPCAIAENKTFENLAEIWLLGDHYKWRAMRANGIDEAFITGNAAPEEKFFAWAQTVPRLLGNPLYHWTHLELQRYFDFYEPLTPENAGEVWKGANEKLKTISVASIFDKFNVFAVGTTDDPADNLAYHKQIAGNMAIKTKVTPSYRPDRALGIEKSDFVEYLGLLSAETGIKIINFNKFLSALSVSIRNFDDAGCLVSDHDLPHVFFEAAHNGSKGALWEEEVFVLFAIRLAGGKLTVQEAESFKTFTLCYLAGEYRKHGWAMQLHIGALRSVNTRMFGALGANTGYDAIADNNIAAKLSTLLDTMEERGNLPKTILYSLNPKDMYPLSALAGSFQGGIAGKMQLGSAWWFLDNRDGMETQLKILANTGLLSRFVGMTTDSRSFLSYPRHEYFRRILCNIIGEWAENGEIPSNWTFLSELVRDVSFGNAKRYFEKGNG